MKNSKVYKFILSIILILAIMYIGTTISKAASFSASISSTSVKVGDTFSVTVTATNAAGMYSVTASNSNASVSNGSTSEFLEDGSATVVFTANKAGSVTITAQATDMTDLDDDTKKVTGSQTFTVEIKEKEPKPEQNTTPTQTENTNTGTNPETTTTQNKPQEKPSFTEVNQTVYATEDDINVRAEYSLSANILGSLKRGEGVTRIGIGSNRME